MERHSTPLGVLDNTIPSRVPGLSAREHMACHSALTQTLREDNWLDETSCWAVEHIDVGYLVMTHSLIRQPRILASVTWHNLPLEVLI